MASGLETYGPIHVPRNSRTRGLWETEEVAAQTQEAPGADRDMLTNLDLELANVQIVLTSLKERVRAVQMDVRRCLEKHDR